MNESKSTFMRVNVHAAYFAAFPRRFVHTMCVLRAECVRAACVLHVCRICIIMMRERHKKS